MANVIKLHKGLNINLKGKAAQEIFTVNAPDTYAIVPDDFHGVTPKVVVKEQENVKAGDALFVDKNHPECTDHGILPVLLLQPHQPIDEYPCSSYRIFHCP